MDSSDKRIWTVHILLNSMVASPQKLTYKLFIIFSSQEEFKISTSLAVWPSENYEVFYQDELIKRGKFDWLDFGSLRRNVLKIQIFFEELNVEMIKEQKSYGIADFASDIGGQLGLWIGFSVLTIAEFIEFIMLLFAHLAQKRTSRSKVKSTTMEMN